MARMSVSRLGYRKLAGATPITVCGLPFTFKVEPITVGSAPYFLFHNRSLSTTVGVRPASSSCASKTLPALGRTPRMEKKLPVAYTPGI